MTDLKNERGGGYAGLELFELFESSCELAQAEAARSESRTAQMSQQAKLVELARWAEADSRCDEKNLE
jgi:hypothetical protein